MIFVQSGDLDDQHISLLFLSLIIVFTIIYHYRNYKIIVALLQRYSHYVAGCSNSSISSRTDLYDLLVNIPAREITVASHAKGNEEGTENNITI